MERVGSRSVWFGVALAFCGAWLPMAAAQPPGQPPGARLQRRFAEIELELQRLKAVGREAEAAPLADELARLRSALEGDYRPTPSDQPEVHLVGLQAGSTAPPGLLTGPDRFTRGYAVVRVTSTEAPVVLALTSNQPVHWQLELAEGVKLSAVALSGHMRSSIGGLPAEALLYECSGQTRHEEAFHAQPWNGPQFPEIAKRMGWLTGCRLRTALNADRYLGQPLVVGPENAEWRQQRLLPAIEALARKATEFDRADRFAKVAELRFEGVFYTLRSAHQHGYYGHGEYAAATAEFTAAGPIESTMRPLDPNVRQVIHDSKENTRFALTQNGELVVYDPLAEEQQQPVPLGGELVNGYQMGAMTFDPLRRRIVVAERHQPFRLAAYRLDDAQWEVLGPLEQPLAGLIYSPELDQLFGVTAVERHQAEQEEQQAASTGQPLSPGAVILRIDAQGKVVDTIRPSVRLGTTFEEPRGTALCLAKGLLVLLPPPKRGAWESAEHPLVIIDPATKDIVYSGRMQPHNGQGKPPADDDSEAPPAGGGGLDRLFKQIQHATAGVELLRSSGRANDADEYARKLAQYRRMLPGAAFAGPPSDEPELHAVSLYRPHGALVELTYTGAPIVLALSGHDSAEWTLRVAPGVRLQKVVVGGQFRQRVEGVPAGVPVETHTFVQQSPSAFFLGNVETSEEAEQALATLERLTGLRPTTLQTLPTNPRTPIVVGPEGRAWRAKLSERALAQLVDDLPPPRDATRERLERIEFQGLWPSLANGQPQFGRRGQAAQSLEWARFTPRGPIGDTLVQLPPDLEQAVVDPQGPTYYAIRGADLLRVDALTGQAEPIAVEAGVPPLNPPLALAFDSKRRRLVIASGHQGFWESYNVDHKAWSLLGRSNLGVFALTYAEQDDALYAFAENHGPFGSGCIKLNPHGALLARYEMAQPGLGYRGRGRFGMPRFAYFRHHGARWQLAHAEGMLFIVRASSQQYPPHPGGATSGVEIDAYDLATGQTTEFGPAKPHPGLRALPPTEFAAVWAELGADDAAAAEKAIWRLAAGGEAVVPEIDRRLTAPPAAEPGRVAKLLEQLDSGVAEERKAAFDELANLGGAIELELAAAAKHRSAEVRSQVRRLQINAKQLLPATAQARQELRALAALELIGSAASRQVLDRVAAEEDSHPRTRAAQQAIDRLDGKPDPNAAEGPQ